MKNVLMRSPSRKYVMQQNLYFVTTLRDFVMHGFYNSGVRFTINNVNTVTESHSIFNIDIIVS